MPVYVGPIVDADNPLYCPAIQFAARKHSWTLKKPAEFVYDTSYNNSNRDSSFKTAPDEYDPTKSPSDLALARKTLRRDNWIKNGGHKRKLDDSESEGFTDMLAPTKYAKSVSSRADSSFDVLLRRESLDYDALRTSSDARSAYFDCRGVQRQPLSSIISRLDSILPGIRLYERLRKLPDPSPETFFNFLAENGYMSEAVLDVLGDWDLDRIELKPEMFHSHYNVYCSKMFRGLSSLVVGAAISVLAADALHIALGKPQKFLSLTEISLCGLKLDDSDIIYFHHLPRLSIMLLDNTGLGNEGVFLLVPLKRTLTRLSLSANPHVGDDAVPALLLLRELVYLSIVGTSIEMGGLRRLAKAIHAENRIMDIEIPAICEAYIDNIHEKYLIDIKPPLIVDPTLCSMLTVTALKRNLEAHAKRNPDILVSGSSKELSQRLAEILRIRQLDTLVLELLDG
ncbi:hypothetical protein CVT24_004194 [Panaeolus cyanescens]|uniref:Uncharacterized protein n=1 Tax=Panaeolus cyanescens TaxID=181874 RepID=A0A409W812_9AGAR|nr:hypothetical protein CVT24_004194 [Panaeolus cyanescens]